VDHRRRAAGPGDHPAARGTGGHPVRQPPGPVRLDAPARLSGLPASGGPFWRCAPGPVRRDGHRDTLGCTYGRFVLVLCNPKCHGVEERARYPGFPSACTRIKGTYRRRKPRVCGGGAFAGLVSRGRPAQAGHGPGRAGPGGAGPDGRARPIRGTLAIPTQVREALAWRLRMPNNQ
jgi:hypothetical protein